MRQGVSVPRQPVENLPTTHPPARLAETEATPAAARRPRRRRRPPWTRPSRARPRGLAPPPPRDREARPCLSQAVSQPVLLGGQAVSQPRRKHTRQRQCLTRSSDSSSASSSVSAALAWLRGFMPARKDSDTSAEGQGKTVKSPSNVRQRSGKGQHRTAKENKGQHHHHQQQHVLTTTTTTTSSTNTNDVV